jgi:hypothetical protein
MGEVFGEDHRLAACHIRSDHSNSRGAHLVNAFEHASKQLRMKKKLARASKIKPGARRNPN